MAKYNGLGHHSGMDKKENIEAGQNKERKPGRNWNESYVIFLVLPIILTILVPLGGLPYLCGRLNLHMGLVIFMLYPATGIFIIYCFFAGIIGLFSNLKKHIWRKRILIVAQIGIPIVFVALFITPFFIPIESDLWPPGKAFTYGFRDRIRNKADIDSIRVWLGTLDKEDYDEFGVRLPRDKWPKSLRALNPPGINLFEDENDNPSVRIVWGGGFFHWGVVIGMEDMATPPSNISEWAECWLPVEAGVYVWDY